MTVQNTDPAAGGPPETTATTAGTVVVELSLNHAKVLARILAHYDVVTAAGDQAIGYDPEVWHKVLIDLLTQRAAARPGTIPPADVAYVPLRRRIPLSRGGVTLEVVR